MLRVKAADQFTNSTDTFCGLNPDHMKINGSSVTDFKAMRSWAKISIYATFLIVLPIKFKLPGTIR